MVNKKKISFAMETKFWLTPYFGLINSFFRLFMATGLSNHNLSQIIPRKRLHKVSHIECEGLPIIYGIFKIHQ